MARPSRAKMCNWLGGAIRSVRTMPSNPADINRMAELARAAEQKLRDLASISEELGWHADASLDRAWSLIQEYDRRSHDSSTTKGEPDGV